MKKQLLLTRMLLLVALLVGSVSSVWAENVTVLSENFSTNNTIDKLTTAGWSFSSNGCSMQSNWLQIASSSYAGTATTPAFSSLVGNTATLTFKHTVSGGDTNRTLTVTGVNCKVNGGTSTNITVGTSNGNASISITEASTTSKITFSASKKAGVRIDDVSVYYTSGPASPLDHITLSGSYPTTFTVGDTFSHEGMVVTATYENSDEKIVTSDAEFSGYNMSAAGNQTVTVSYTESEVTKTAEYEITVNPYIQPLGVDITPNYTFYGKDAQFSGNTNDEVTGTKDNITVTYTRNEGSCYANENAMRFYKDNDLKISAPDGYHIIGIELTASDSDSDITTDVGSYSTVLDKWSGDESSVTFSRPSDASSYATISKIAVTLAPKVRITAAKYATFASDYDLDFSSMEGKGLYAYTATVAGDIITFNRVTKAKEGEGLLLYANVNAQTDFYVPAATDSPAFVPGNKLVRGTGAAVASAGDNSGEYNYVLSNNGDVINFYLANGKTVDTNKAYLKNINPTAVSAKFFLPTGGEETDGINAVSTAVENGVRYNLAGQRVGNDYKGIVIVNGKKYVRK